MANNHQQQSTKSLFWTYILLLVGGFFGLHQIYLGRFRHAFTLWISFGGYFGLGLIRELWRIPEYVAEVNGDEKYTEKLVESMRTKPKPSFGLVRYFGSIVVADILGYLVMGAIPHELFGPNGTSDNLVSKILITLLVPFACAFGVHLVGNVGRCSGSIKWPLLAAYLTGPLYWFNVNSVFMTSLAALIAFSKYSLEWRRTPLKHTEHTIGWPCGRYSLLLFCIVLYLSLWTSWFYFNCTVTDKNDETIKCRVAVKNFFNSPAWLECRTVLKNLWAFIRTHGIMGLWNEVVESLDPQGEKNALKILDLNETATQDDITLNYRRLARIWHPDKHTGTEQKKQAQEKFMAIQQAYELLSKMKRKRLKKQFDQTK